MSATQVVQAAQQNTASSIPQSPTQNVVNAAATIPTPQEHRPTRDHRVTSYHHPFQTRCQPSDDPAPSYAVASRMSRFPPAPRHFDNGNEVLPRYTCTVSREGPMYMRIEKISPFQYLPKQSWRQVYVVVCGTQVSVHKIKIVRLAGYPMPTPGYLIKRYTTQHAEIGLASDVEYEHLLPASRIAQFIPTAARRKAYEKDPDLFTPIKQVVMRLRLESDQLLLSDSSEERIFKWIHDISASIDISLPLDERAAPKPCTIPRRRRRQRNQGPENIHDSTVIEEQERIMQELYPSLARSASGPVENTAQDSNRLALTLTTSNDQEAEDVDLSALAEDMGSAATSALRPDYTRQSTSSTVSTTDSSHDVLVTSPENIDINGKWAPLHANPRLQQWRYIRRCMPTLLYDAPRPSAIIMCHGRRMRINAKMDMLEEWQLLPPSYAAHEFPAGLDRTITMASSLATTSSTISTSTVDSGKGKAAQTPSLHNVELASSNKIKKRTSMARAKIPERTLMEEGSVVVAF